MPGPSQRDASVLVRAAAFMPPQYVALLLFGLLLGLLHLFYPPRLSYRIMTVDYAVKLMGLFALVSVARDMPALLRAQRGDERRAVLRRTLQMIADWFPFVVCTWVYENLHDLTQWIRPDTVDHTLARADEWLFGVQPTLWLEQYAHPLLTDYMALAYMMYFVMPPLLAGWLYLRGHTEAFKEFQLALLLVFYGGFLGYITVPAVGPRYVIGPRYRSALTGRYFYWNAAQTISDLQLFARDCFPSLHTAVSSVCLVFYLRHHDRMPWRPLVTPLWITLIVSLWISTVYLRYHWVVDVLAGWALATVCSLGGIALQRHWPRRTAGRYNAPLLRNEREHGTS